LELIDLRERWSGDEEFFGWKKEETEGKDWKKQHAINAAARERGGKADTNGFRVPIP
jgi:hypothetical protein